MIKKLRNNWIIKNKSLSLKLIIAYILINEVCEGDFSEKIQSFKNNKVR
jgi:hypothetical protein